MGISIYKSTNLIIDEFFKQLFENLPEATIIHDYHGKILEVNTTASLSLGLSKEELKSMTILELDISFPELSVLQDEWDKLEHEKSITLHGDHKIKNLGIKQVEIRFNKIQNIYIAQIRDISSRIDSSINSYAEPIKRLFHHSHDAFFMLNGKNHFIDCNLKAEEMTGYSKAELTGKSFIDMSAEYQSEDWLSGLFEPSENKDAFEDENLNFEWIFKKKNGTDYPIDISLYVFKVKNDPYKFILARDISDKKDKEKELQREKDKLTQVMETSPIGITVLNKEGQITYANKRAEKILGLTKHDITQLCYNAPEWHITDFNGDPFPDGDLPFSKVMGTGKPVYNINHAIVWPDGQRKLLSINAAPLMDDSKNLDGMIATISDVTAKIKAEMTLNESRRFNEIILNNTPDIIYVYDIIKKINIYSNNGIMKVLGYTIEEMKQMGDKLVETLMYPDDFVIYSTKTTQRYQTADDGELIDHEYRMKHKDGSWHWLLSKESIFKRNADGTPQQIFGIISDITTNKLAGLKLQDSEKQFRQLFENMEQGFALHEIVYDKNENPIDYIFILINEAFERLTGLKSNDIIGKTVTEIIPQIEPIWIENYGKVAKYGKPMQFESYSQGLSKYYNVIAYSPKKNFFAVVFTDITKMKQYEGELINAKERAEESNNLKSVFLHNLSHEIRTPMNGIIGFSDLLDKEDISEEKRNNYCKIIQNSGYQLLKVIDDILEISTLETKQVRLNEEQFNLNDLIMEQFAIFDLKAKERNLSLYVNRTINENQSHIITDKTKLTKIISNLIENAMKFTNEGSIEIGSFLEGNFIKIYVKDTGIGIAPDKSKVIFERFSQGDIEISRKHGGLGLGLSISKENAKLLGGDITFESERGKGTTFFVDIPYKPVDIFSLGDDIVNKNKLEESRNNRTFLIAEDEEINFLYLEKILDSYLDYNINIIHARNGKEAVDFCLNNKDIDIILMDIKMPIMDGLEATRKIKSEFISIPIIAQTAYSTESEKQMAFNHGCDDFISKPIKKEKLYEIIKKHLKSK